MNGLAQQINLWHLNAPEDTEIQGVSVEKAYALLGSRALQPILVAVIDDGVDISHPGFKNRIWFNLSEIAGNGIDDDGNGYIDDINGWNFLGNTNGEEITGATTEITRLYKEYKTLCDTINPVGLKGKTKQMYNQYLEYEAQYNFELELAKENFQDWAEIATLYEGAYAYMADKLGTEDINLDDLQSFTSSNSDDIEIRNFLVMAEVEGLREELVNAADEMKNTFNYHYNLDIEPWRILNEAEAEEKAINYGNSHVWAGDPKHGTHVSGLIASNNYAFSPTKGIAVNAIILPLRVVPDGDERDKDVAKAIRYAVDMGARIINMSFGKSFSPNRNLVDSAIEYATERDVLFIHAAGNDGINIDKVMQFPCGSVKNGRKNRSNWINVGASGSVADTTLLAEFSNYGAKSVDILAPGVNVWSLKPDSAVARYSGTSFSAPIVSGMAAFIMGAYPNLKASQVKSLITASTSEMSKLVVNYESGKSPLKKLIRNPGIPSLYRALKLADERYGRK